MVRDLQGYAWTEGLLLYSTGVLVGRLWSILHVAPKSLGSPVLYLVGASHSGDRNASNIWGKSRLYLRPRTRETAGSGGLSSAGEMPHPRSLEAVDEPWAFVTRPHQRTFLKLVEDRSIRVFYWASEWET